MAFLTFALRGLLTLLGFYTRLPLPNHRPLKLSQGSWSAPVVGVIIGIIVALPVEVINLTLSGQLLSNIFDLGYLLNDQATATTLSSVNDHLRLAGLSLLTMVMLALVTGMLHEDAWADCADSLLASSPDKRWKIAHDPQCGSFGVVALIFLFALRGILFASLIANNLLIPVLPVAFALARSTPFGIAALCKHNTKSLSMAMMGKISPYGLVCATIICCLLFLRFMPWQVAITYFIIHDGFLLFLGFLLARKYAGIGGDQLGALIVISELLSISLFLVIF